MHFPYQTEQTLVRTEFHNEVNKILIVEDSIKLNDLGVSDEGLDFNLSGYLVE